MHPLAFSRLPLAAALLLLTACVAPQEEARSPEPPPPAPPELQRKAEFPVADAALTTEASRAMPAREAYSSMPMGVAAFAPCCAMPPLTNTERYGVHEDNPVHRVTEQPVSTFSVDVDTGSYANVRRFLNAGQLPPEDAVRVEEMLNYFDYSYAEPASRAVPFRVATELARTPWNRESLLLKVGIKGYSLPQADRPPANLVFLIDVSGSMQSQDKLPLLKNAFRLLTQQLSAKDRVSMVVYAGASGVVLEPTAGDRKQAILGALSGLEAGGSTNGAAGIEKAYDLARASFIDGGINRVILATDGDFNVGTVNFDALLDLAERERASGVALTTLGFGTGNYNERLIEQLADAGNGNYAYVDTLSEARKVLVEELSSTLYTIARDVKIQVEFNPAEVLEYRLIGYENRLLEREDFNNDQVDAGDIGAGHRVTALYEIVPANGRGRVDPLRYGGGRAPATTARNGELAFVRLRYKEPQGEAASKLIEFPVLATSLVTAGRESADFRFAASVAAFGQKLRGGKYLEGFGYEDIRNLARPTLDGDTQGYRREFLALVDLAATLTPQASASVVRE
jgi:Ca-activated chloride channel family protein